MWEFDYSISNNGETFLKNIISNEQYKDWFNSKRINVLNKSICGNGGTTGFIRYAKENNRGILILVPNVSITMSKEEKYSGDSDICCVYGGSDRLDPDALVVVATYDQFEKMTKSIRDYGMDMENRFWSRRCIVVDEYHKLVDESDFRYVMLKMTKLIKETDNSVVLMSATPHWGYVDLLRKYVKDKTVVTYTINYDTSYDPILLKKKINVIPIKKDLKDIIKKCSDHNKQVCVLYNNVSDIVKILNQIGNDGCEILCSSRNEKECDCYYSKKFNPNKKLHFMTSAFFTGHDVDIFIDRCIIVGSQQYNYLSYGERDLKQMLGRFRKSVEGITVLVLDRPVDKNNYNEIKNEYDTINDSFEDYGEDEWSKHYDKVIQKQKLIYLQDALDRTRQWGSVKGVIELINKIGHIGVERKIGEYEYCSTNKKIPFKIAKQKVIQGEELDYKEYPLNYMLVAYYQVFGAEKLNNSSIRHIKDWYKIHSLTSGIDLETLSREELFDVFGFKEFGVYKSRYLLECIRYLSYECEYDMLSRMFYEVFGCYIVIYRKGNHESRDDFMVIKVLPNDKNGNEASYISK